MARYGRRPRPSARLPSSPYLLMLRDDRYSSREGATFARVTSRMRARCPPPSACLRKMRSACHADVYPCFDAAASRMRQHVSTPRFCPVTSSPSSGFIIPLRPLSFNEMLLTPHTNATNSPSTNHHAMPPRDEHVQARSAAKSVRYRGAVQVKERQRGGSIENVIAR